MAFDIKDVGENLANGVKKYPWILGGGVVAVLAVVLLTRSSGGSSSGDETVAAYTYPGAVSATDNAESVVDALAGMNDYLESALDDMGDVVAQALADNQAATILALDAVVAANADLAESVAKNSVVAVTTNHIDSIITPTESVSITRSSSNGDSPKIIGTLTADNGITSNVADTSGGKKVVVNNNNTATVGINTYKPDGHGGWKQVG